MTGSVIARHTAETVASAKAGGARVCTLSFHPGAFAQSDVVRTAATPWDGSVPGVVYLRALTRLPGGRRPLRDWLARWRAVRRLVRAGGPVVMVREPQGMSLATARLQWVLGLCLAVGLGRNLTLRSAEMPPVTLLERELRISAEPVAPLAAEAQLMAHIRAHSTSELRLTEAHVARALAHPQNSDLRRTVWDDLLSLAQSARRISARDVETALRHGSLQVMSDTPRAVRSAYAASDRHPDMPRIAEHLRLIGKRRRHWIRYVPPEHAGHWSGRGRDAVVLRHLAGLSEPGDKAELAALQWPVCPGAEGPAISRLEWYLIVALRLPLRDMGSVFAPWACPSLAASLAELRPAVERCKPSQGQPARLRLTGIARNGTGLAQNFWMAAQALGRAGLAPELHAVDTAERLAPVLPFPPARDRSGLRLTRDVTLYNMNADRIPQEMLAEDRPGEAFAIGHLLWELDKIPAAHALALEMLDEVWVPSVFLKRLYQSRFARDVVLMRKAIDLPAPVRMPPPPPGVRRFITCFDQRSSVERKNPMAAVRAFGDAFGSRRDVELVVKTTPAGTATWAEAGGQMRALATAAAQDKRIKLIRAHLPLPELLGLIASAEALISPHRAEGFGYFPAFALSLGVPVIVTDHSGPQDFCTPATSFPVPAELVPVPDGQMPWRTAGARWADVDQGALADTLREVFDHPDTARARAERGRLVMETDYSPTALTRRYTQRLERTGLATIQFPRQPKTADQRRVPAVHV